MKQEDKELLLKDLCARSSYNLIVQIEDCGIWNLRGIDHDDSAELRDRVIVWHGKSYPSSKNSFPIINCKPFLFPLSSMTEEKRKEYYNLCIEEEREQLEFGEWVTRVYYHNTIESIDWLNEHHFDFRGLIEKGLAIDCTNLNIY